MTFSTETDFPLLSNIILRTDSREKALAVAEKHIAHMDVSFHAASGPFEFQLAAQRLGNLDLLTLDQKIFGGSDIVVHPVVEQHTIEIPIIGMTEVATGQNDFLVARGRSAAIISASEKAHWSDHGLHYRALNVQISEKMMASKLTALTGETVSGPIVFDPEIDQSTPKGRGVCALVEQAFQLLDGKNALLNNPLTAAHYEELIVVALLSNLQHNGSHLLSLVARSAGSATVSRSEEFMRAHADKTLSIEEVAREMGVSIRSLQRSFQESRGTSPMRVLKDIRLDLARERLLIADSDSSVTKVAMATGFNHLGAFSVDYRKKFGESPSQTLLRS